VVERTLSLFGCGELRALRVITADVFRLVLSMGQPLPDGGVASSHLAQALGSVRVIQLTELPAYEDDQVNAAAVIERCAAAVTELKGRLPHHLLGKSDRWGRPPVLARCTRLEVLTEVSRFTPGLWLGLSQLHTLESVDFGQVSAAAIAAALPRLHTLSAFGAASDPPSVAGFFTDLLPRLRAFRFNGLWPTTEAENAAALTAPPLPLLEELRWFADYPPRSTAFRRFFGARPTLLYTDSIGDYLLGRDGAEVEPACGMLTRVCELLAFQNAIPFDPYVATVLRAAPRLRTFTTSQHEGGEASWLTAPTAPVHPAFVGLVHRQLRDFRILDTSAPASDDGCVSRLQRTCFPKLRKLEVCGKELFATPLVS
jgi:hypothetical protein